jgi:hypothetical protein
MAKPRKAEKRLITEKPILKVGGSNFKLWGTMTTHRLRRKVSAVAAPGNIGAGFAPLHDVATVIGSSFSLYVGIRSIILA